MHFFSLVWIFLGTRGRLWKPFRRVVNSFYGGWCILYYQQEAEKYIEGDLLMTGDDDDLRRKNGIDTLRKRFWWFSAAAGVSGGIPWGERGMGGLSIYYIYMRSPHVPRVSSDPPRGGKCETVRYCPFVQERNRYPGRGSIRV